MSINVGLLPPSIRTGDVTGTPPFVSGSDFLVSGTSAIAQSGGTPTFSRQAPPLAATRGIAAITGSQPDLSDIEFYRIDRWSNAGGIRPPLSTEAVRALSGNRDLAGQSFTQGDRDVAVVEGQAIAQSATRFGVTQQQSGDYWSAQEIAHAYFAAGNEGGQDEDFRSRNELFGEAAAASVNPRMATLSAMTYLAWDRRGAPAEYGRYLDIAETSLDETLTQAGFTESGGKTPAQRFNDGLFDAWRRAGQTPFHQVYDRYVETFVRENAPAGSSIDPAQLRATIQANYVDALTDAAREIAP